MGILDNLFGGRNGPETAAFSMKAGTIFFIGGRGALVTGKVLSGAISSGETAYFTAPDGSRHSCRVEVELDQEAYPGVTKAGAGMTAGLLLLGADRSEVAEGMLITGAPQ